jgi:mRNA-degrading endonuclease RelE of RelBE toxin-antitoxin system
MYTLIFSKKSLKQSSKLSANAPIKNILCNKFNLLEEKGPDAGKILDVSLQFYEIKIKRPPLRIYFFTYKSTIEILFVEMETSSNSQQKLIEYLEKYIRSLRLFAYIFYLYRKALFLF